ncbi:MAG: protein kinase, partial [Gemmatimonadetes bacterium]|nr:protein kinase [Gemmatimonadota bacterium]
MSDPASRLWCPVCDATYGAEQTFCSRDGAALRRLADTGDLVGQVIGDKYRVLKRLGEGGMGQVFLAQHVMINRRSALKVMHPDLRHDPQAVSRFTREATNASSIEHPNVAAIYDYGVTRDGLVFLNMEYLDGRSLATVLAE